METLTTTIDSVETTSVVTPQLAVVTATEASEGVEVGDVTVLMADAVQDALDALIRDVVASCGAGARLRKRDREFRLPQRGHTKKRMVLTSAFFAPPLPAMSCMINAMQGAAQNGESLGLVNPAEWDSFALEIAGNAPDILSAAVQVFKTQAERNKFAIFLAAAGTAGAFAAEPIAEVAHKFIFGDGLFGHPTDPKGGGNDDDDQSHTEQSTASPSTSACDPSATADENSVCIGLERLSSAWPPC